MDIFSRIYTQRATANPAKLGRVCRVKTRGLPYHWQKVGYIPPEYWRDIQRATQGKVTILDLYNAFYPD